MIELKIDNRYKDGKIVKTGNIIKGNAKTLEIKKVHTGHEFATYTVLIVSHALGEALKQND